MKKAIIAKCNFDFKLGQQPANSICKSRKGAYITFKLQNSNKYYCKIDDVYFLIESSVDIDHYDLVSALA